MTDLQIRILLDLVAEKFRNCKNEEDVQKAIAELRALSRSDEDE